MREDLLNRDYTKENCKIDQDALNDLVKQRLHEGELQGYGGCYPASKLLEDYTKENCKAYFVHLAGMFLHGDYTKENCKVKEFSEKGGRYTLITRRRTASLLPSSSITQT